MSYALRRKSKSIRAMSFHDQFGYTPEPKNLGPVLLRYALQHNAELRRCHVSTCPRERTSPKALVHAEKYV